MIPYSEITPSVAAPVGNAIKDAAAAAGKMICNLYNNYPWAFGDRSGASGLAHAVMDNLCRPPFPPANPPPINDAPGGQCCASVYDVFYRQILKNPYRVITTSFSRVTGRVDGLSRFKTGTPPADNWNYRLKYIECNGTIKTTDPFAFSVDSGQSGSIDRIVLVSGLNNCGNRPPDPQPPIPPGDLIQNFNITLPGGTPFTFTFRPQISLNAYPIIVNVNNAFDFKFYIDGLNIGDGPGGQPDLQPILDLLDELQEQIDNISEDQDNQDQENHNYPSGGNRPTTSTPGNPDGEEEGVSGLAYILIDLISIPQSGRQKVQFSGNNSPSVYYAGWVEFRRGDHHFPREQISFAKSCFQAPKGADGYAYAIVTGFQASVQVVRFTAD